MKIYRHVVKMCNYDKILAFFRQKINLLNNPGCDKFEYMNIFFNILFELSMMSIDTGQ